MRLKLKYHKWWVVWEERGERFGFSTDCPAEQVESAQGVLERFARACEGRQLDAWAEKIPAIAQWLYATGRRVDPDSEGACIAAENALERFAAEMRPTKKNLNCVRFLNSQVNVLYMTHKDAAWFASTLTEVPPPKYLADEICAAIRSRRLTKREIAWELAGAGVEFTDERLVNALRNASAFVRHDDGTYSAKRRRGGLKAHTVNNYVMAARMFFRWAVKRGLRRDDPFEDVRPLRCQAPAEIVFLDRAERDRLLKSPKCPVSVWIAVLAGLRRGEIGRLDWRDVDWAGRWIVVRKSKTGRPRHVPVCTDLMAKLEAVGRGKRQGSVCGWDLPKMYKSDKDIEMAVEAAPDLVAKLRWNVFRHTFASMLAQTGRVSIDQICAMMGNTPEVCRRHYAHLVPGAAAKTGIDWLNISATPPVQ